MLVWAISTHRQNGPIEMDRVEIAYDWCLVCKYSSVIHTPYLDISGIHTRIYNTVQSRHNVHIQTYAVYSMEFLLIDITLYSAPQRFAGSAVHSIADPSVMSLIAEP